MKLFLNFAVDTNCFNKKTLFTALHWCCMWGDLESIKLLLENGAHSFLPTKDGHYPIDFAGWKGHKDCVEYLI